MGRRELNRLFRTRLAEAMGRAGINQTNLAAQTGIDRSTLSQLLSQEMNRLPRADTVAALAIALHVSLDWLLGLSHEDTLGADIRTEGLEITSSTGEPIEASLAQWYEEAAGYKIRYVPASLPDLINTEAVTQYQYDRSAGKKPDQVIAENIGRLEYIRLPETDVEICMPLQAIDVFVRGEAQWSGLSASARREQLDHMSNLTDELYPGLRLFFYDVQTHYSVPYTVFGNLRAAVYMGQMYFVFNTYEHIRALSLHFDSLIRAAVIQAPDASRYLASLRDSIGED
ncbi:MAG: helix-turn-helix transcriptional regulator [Rhodospirillales bacterium]|nr:helix-turn-helix transcriptional regulator [Rhodospirillales bacterium]